MRHERDDGRFEARGEQMMRMEHLADRRRWEESMARDGEGVVGGFEGDEDDMLPGMFFYYFYPFGIGCGYVCCVALLTLRLL